MEDNKDETDVESNFTEVGRLRHENKYLKDRVDNLSKFKTRFFEVQHKLVWLNEKIGILEQLLQVKKLKERVFGRASEQDIDDRQTESILKLFHESFSASNYQDIVMSLLQSTQGLGVDIAIQIKIEDEEENYSLDEVNKEANIELINRYKSEDKEVEQDDFVIVNTEYISMVAKFSPDIDARKKKDIKEYLGIIVIGSNSHIDSIFKREELQSLRNNIYKIFKKTNQSFSDMQDAGNAQTIKISEMNLAYEERLKDELSRINLSDGYMELLVMIIEDARKEQNLLLTSSITMDKDFLDTMKKLEQAYAKKYTDIN